MKYADREDLEILKQYKGTEDKDKSVGCFFGIWGTNKVFLKDTI